jgi:cell division protein FtsW
LSNLRLMAPRRRREQSLEQSLLITATFCLLAGGAVMVYSASSTRTLLQGQGDGSGYLVKYLIFGALGLVCMHVLARHGLSVVRRLTPLLWLGAFVLCVAVLLPGVGVEANGARRWLGIGSVRFQPSELLKLALVLQAAAVIGARPALGRNLRSLGPVAIVAVPSLLLVGVLQRDLGTALVMAMALTAVLIAAGLPMRQLGLLAGGGTLVVAVMIALEPYRMTRVASFLNPWADAGGSGFQAVQGQIAIGSGGLIGQGPGGSVQKAFFLPEAHTDFILAVIGEELGVVGIVVLLVLYGMIAYAGLRTARAAKGAYAKLLAAGVTSLILCQALLNSYAVLGLAPLTGIPLPFISSGSSSLIVLLCSMGLLLNVAGGGSAHLQPMGGGARGDDARGDRGRRDRRPRRAGDGGGRRAAG